jgi:hypothetical protein
MCFVSNWVSRLQEPLFEGKMSGAVLVAIAASIGNLLQGWDNATIAGKSR